MANNKRLFLSLSEEDILKLDKLRAELGMNRSQYIRYVLSGQRKVINPSIKYRELVNKLAELELCLRVIALKDTISLQEKLEISMGIKELKKILDEKGTFGQVDQK